MIRALHLTLALVIALTAQTFAIARGETMRAGEVVLCLGGQAITVSVDENGQPTGPAHICPDMALSLMAGFSTALPDLQPVLGRSEGLFAPVALASRAAETLTPSARGPPLSV